MEKFLIRKQLIAAEGQPGRRDSATMRAISINLGALMQLCGSTLLKATLEDDFLPWANPGFISNLLDVKIFLQEITILQALEATEEIENQLNNY